MRWNSVKHPRRGPSGWAGTSPSADVMGDIAASMGLDPLRALLRLQHRRAKRNKGFGRGKDGFRWLILDGHEGVASYRRSWKNCLERVVHFAKGTAPSFTFVM